MLIESQVVSLELVGVLFEYFTGVRSFKEGLVGFQDVDTVEMFANKYGIQRKRGDNVYRLKRP